MVAADVPHLDGRAAELDVEPVPKHDVGRGNPDFTRRGQLLLDVRGVLGRSQARGHATIERFVAPICGRQFGQRCRRQGLCNHGHLQRGCSEDVIPMGVGERHLARRGNALGGEPVEDEPRVSR